MFLIKTILNKIKIHKATYLFLLLAILTGSFHLLLITFILLFIHELGHFLTALLFNWKTENINFYPFGGIAKFSSEINCPIKEELLVLIMGPFFQVLGYLFLKALPLTSYQHQLLTLIHYNILLFNLLPIYPLDGGRILQVFLCYFSSYKMSYAISFYISYLFLFSLFVYFFLTKNINIFIIVLILIFRLIVERKNIKYYLERFFLERYLKKYPYKKLIIIDKPVKFKRECYHLIKNNRWYQREEEFLTLKYRQNKNS